VNIHRVDAAAEEGVWAVVLVKIDAFASGSASGGAIDGGMIIDSNFKF